MQNPQSRNEAILQSIINDTEYTAPPQSRIEALLLELKGQLQDLQARVEALENN